MQCKLTRDVGEVMKNNTSVFERTSQVQLNKGKNISDEFYMHGDPGGDRPDVHDGRTTRTSKTSPWMPGAEPVC